MMRCMIALSCFAALVAMSSVLSSAVLAAEAAPVRLPNIVMILIDDMGWGDFSCFGNKNATTPNIDRLAAGGLRFEQFYVASPICSPSRVGLSTGQYPQRWRITSYLNNRVDNTARGMAQWLAPKAPMLARSLHDAGYATGHFGKWHMGGQRDVDDAPPITVYVFDASLTNFEGMGPKLLPLTLKPGDDKPGRIWEDAERLGQPVAWMQRSEITTGFADAALAFIDASARDGKPFYVNLWPDDVHSPFWPPVDQWRDGRWKLLCTYDGSSPQLYDLDADPSEERNLAAEQPAETARLTAAAVAWHRSLPADNTTYRPPATKKNRSCGAHPHFFMPHPTHPAMLRHAHLAALFVAWLPIARPATPAALAAPEDIYTQIARQPFGNRAPGSMERPAPPVLAATVLDWNGGEPAPPLDSIDTPEKLRTALADLRTRMALFLQELQPKLTPTRWVQSVDRMQFRLESAADRADFLRPLTGLGEWQTVAIPHYTGPGEQAVAWQPPRHITSYSPCCRFPVPFPLPHHPRRHRHPLRHPLHPLPCRHPRPNKLLFRPAHCQHGLPRLATRQVRHLLPGGNLHRRPRRHHAHPDDPLHPPGGHANHPHSRPRPQPRLRHHLHRAPTLGGNPLRAGAKDRKTPSICQNWGRFLSLCTERAMPNRRRN